MRISPFIEQIIDPTVNPFASHPSSSTVYLTFPVPPAHASSHDAAAQFQRKFQDAVLKTPGSIRASRKDLGFSEHQIAMIDIGGEGQKTESLDEGDLLKSGNVHAINVNAQPVASPGRFFLQRRPGEDPSAARNYQIPNLVRPAEDWPSSNEQAHGLLPFENGFSNLTMTEGAPVFDYHVKEMSRVTSPDGWMMLAVDDSFKPRIDDLARAHNGGGTVWQFPPKDGAMDRYVIPPRSAVESSASNEYKAMWSDAGAHDAFDVAQTIALHRRSGLSVDEAKSMAPSLQDANGEIDFSKVAQPRIPRDEL